MRAIAYMEMGKKDKAKEYLEKASGLNDFDKEVAILLESVH